VDAEDVADMLSVLLRKPMQVSLLSPYVVEGEKKYFIFVEEAKYMVLTGFAKVVREQEEISGDNYAFLESEKGKMTILLSDGTGSGEQASKDSGQVLDVLEKMLEAGYDIERAIELINSSLYVKSRDNNHPTLDVCQLDLHGGTCDFYKVGGAVSFLKRGKHAEVIKKGNLPLGIFQKADAHTWSGCLQEGDYIIMMSDGVLDAFGQEDYEAGLQQLICELEEQHPGELAEILLHKAICTAGGHISDDMTVLVAGMWENSGIT
jgi:stage II sporulation protein E